MKPRKNENAPLKGVYSTPFEAKGKDGGKVLRKIYWGVWEAGVGVYEIQPLNQNMVPIGQRQRIAASAFSSQFTPEPDFFIKRPTVGMSDMAAPAMPATPVTPDALSAQTVAKQAEPDAPQEPKAVFEAVSREMETLQAEGRAQLRRGETAKAVDTFRRILALQGPFEPEHKVVFNGCGIDMRKAKQFEEAISFYKKAMEVDQADENLYHNIARALYDKGDMDLALEYLRLGLSMNPDFKQAKLFVRHIEKTRKAGEPVDVDRPVRKDPAKKVYRF